MVEQVTKTQEETISDTNKWIDDCFRAYKTEYCLWNRDKKDVRALVTALTEDVCIQMTRFYLKGEQDGWAGHDSRVMNDGKVGGKL